MTKSFHQIRDHILKLYRQKSDPALEHLDFAQLTEMLSAGESPGSASPRGGKGVSSRRWQDDLIEEELPEGASVLDLGCGGGELLARLIASKKIRAQGVELDPEAVAECVERGVAVFQADLDDYSSLRLPDRSFDYVILEETLPTLKRPIEVLGEMLRVGRFGIVSFPNFAHWRVRIDLALQGRMPRTECLPDEWHETANIRLFTIRDFMDWAERHDVEILGGHVLADNRLRKISEADNLFAEEALLIVAREGATRENTKGEA